MPGGSRGAHNPETAAAGGLTPPTAPAGASATLTRDPLGEGPGTQRFASEFQPSALAQIRDPERYQVIGEHGRGGLGRVSRAHDRELGRDVAIKELIARSPINEARFLREALITARLEHPGIVAVHEAGRWPDGTPFYAMKLVSGRPLRDLIAERTTVDERLGLLHHVIAVADAIAYAHGRNIIHRDLKPSNVIVGDFGETVVIDWGLAKDLGATGTSATGGGGFGIGDRDLTSTGNILGTPAYMAPEQERGEYVDQRADVFAIGAMLWELCALQRVFPIEARQRRRVLKSAGIDRDLATIVDKALDSDPARRYPDAGALATDLKAFKSGARIAARHYSLAALVVHRIRRHRALALSITAAVALAAAGVVVFVENITAERDRADAALVQAEAVNNDRILEHAALLLNSDPTAARAALSEYRGRDQVRHRRLIAEAEGRGVARAIYAPHADVVAFAVGDRSGAIASIGQDHRVQLTQAGATITLASDVSTELVIAYAPASHLLAYAVAPDGIAVLDLHTRTVQRIAAVKPDAMRFAPDGSRLAALDGRGELRVWSTQDRLALGYRSVIPGARKLRFATPARLIVQVASAIQAIALDGSGGEPARAALPSISSLDASPDAVAAGTQDGRIVVLGLDLQPRATGAVCRDQLRGARFLAGSDLLAFACRDKIAGVARYDAARREVTVVDTFATRGLAEVTPDPTGRYVAVIDETSSAYLYDTQTRLVSRYQGDGGQPSYVVAPSPEFAHVLVGDVTGAVRLWDPPSSAARVVVQSSGPVFGVSFTPDSKVFVTGGADGVVRRVELASGAVTELRGHTEAVMGVLAAPDGSTLLSMSDDRTLRAWPVNGVGAVQQFARHLGAVEDAAYVERGRRVASAGDDGRVWLWSAVGEAGGTASDARVIFQHTAPLTDLELLSRTDHLAIKDNAGAIWDLALDGRAALVRSADSTVVTLLCASPDGSYLAAASATGQVVIYDTATWRVIKTVQLEGKVRRIQFDPKNRDLMIAAEAGRARAGYVEAVSLRGDRLRWREVAAAARDVAYSSDGELLGFACADGGTWLYSIRSDTWAYARDHDSESFNGKFSPDGAVFVTTDRRGTVVARSVPDTLHLANHSPTEGP
jgi:WD40 repeat protein